MAQVNPSANNPGDWVLLIFAAVILWTVACCSLHCLICILFYPCRQIELFYESRKRKRKIVPFNNAQLHQHQQQQQQQEEEEQQEQEEEEQEQEQEQQQQQQQQAQEQQDQLHENPNADDGNGPFQQI